MSQYTDNLNQLWDVPAIRQQRMDAVDEVKQYLAEVTAASQKIRGLEFSIPTSSLRNLAEYVKSAEDLTTKSASIMKKLAESELILAKAEKELAQARLINAKAAKEEEEQSVRTAKAATEEAKRTTELSKQKEIEQRMTIALQKEMERLEKARLREEEQLRKNGSAYELLKKQYNDASKAALDLGARTNANNPEFIAAAQNVKKLHDQLYALEAAMGINKRNVGNYKEAWNGMNNAIMQLTREMPAFANSVQTGLMGISNNIGTVKDAIDQARIKNAELVAQGQAAIPIWKQMGAAIISWNTALSVGVTLLTVFGPKVWDALTGSSEAAKAAAEANKKYRDSLVAIDEAARKTAAEEISRLRVLESVATNETASREKRNEAAKKMIDMYPGMLQGYDQEAIKAGKAADAVNNLAAALLKKAVADAAGSKYAASFLNQLDLAEKMQKADEAASNARDEYWAAVAAIQDGEEVDDFFGIQSRKAQAEKFAAEVTAAYRQAAREAYSYRTVANKAMAEVPSLLDDKKDKKGKGTDTTNEEVSISARIAKSKAELRKVDLEDDINKQKVIFENEKLFLGNRMQALISYFESKRALNNIDKNAELEGVDAKLAKIEEIEAKSASKRTAQEKKLLREKEVLLSERQAIVAKYQIKENDIIAEGEKIQQKILDDTVKHDKEALEQRAANAKKYADEIYRKWYQNLQKQQADDEKYAKAKIKLEEQLAQARINLMRSVADAAFDLSALIYDNQERNIDRTVEKNRISKEEELSYIASLDISDKDRRDRKYRAEQQAFVAEKEIAKERESIERKRYAMQQAASLANIVFSTQQAVAKIQAEAAVLAATPATATLAPMAYAQIPFVVGSAAVSAAIIAAQVFAYAKGTGKDGHPGGMALIGEGGEDELVFEPGKQPYWVNKPVLKNLAKDSHVFPMHRLNQMGYATAADVPIGNMQYGDSQALMNAIAHNSEKIGEIVSAIENKPVANVILDGNGVQMQLNNGSVTLEWITRNIAD